MRGMHEHDCDHGHLWVCKQWDCRLPEEWNCLPHQKPQQGPKQGAERLYRHDHHRANQPHSRGGAAGGPDAEGEVREMASYYHRCSQKSVVCFLVHIQTYEKEGKRELKDRGYRYITTRELPAHKREIVARGGVVEIDERVG
jgi:hypothetical protein